MLAQPGQILEPIRGTLPNDFRRNEKRRRKAATPQHRQRVTVKRRVPIVEGEMADVVAASLAAKAGDDVRQAHEPVEARQRVERFREPLDGRNLVEWHDQIRRHEDSERMWHSHSKSQSARVIYPYA